MDVRGSGFRAQFRSALRAPPVRLVSREREDCLSTGPRASHDVQEEVFVSELGKAI
jgi:hypothetical protein